MEATQIHKERVWVLLIRLNWAAVSKMIHKHSQSIHISAAIQVLACPLPTWAQCPYRFTWTGIHTNTHILRRSSCGDKSRWWGGLSNSGTRRHTHVIPSVIERVCKWTTIELVVHRNMKQQRTGAVRWLEHECVCTAGVCGCFLCIYLHVCNTPVKIPACALSLELCICGCAFLNAQCTWGHTSITVKLKQIVTWRKRPFSQAKRQEKWGLCWSI